MAVCMPCRQAQGTQGPQTQATSAHPGTAARQRRHRAPGAAAAQRRARARPHPAGPPSPPAALPPARTCSACDGVGSESPTSALNATLVAWCRGDLTTSGLPSCRMQLALERSQACNIAAAVIQWRALHQAEPRLRMESPLAGTLASACHRLAGRHQCVQERRKCSQDRADTEHRVLHSLNCRKAGLT